MDSNFNTASAPLRRRRAAGHTALLLLTYCLLPAPGALAQLAPLAEGGARSLALGRATTAIGGDVWGIANPASWSFLDSPRAAVFASQAHGMSELRLASAAAAYPTRYGVAAVAARTYGFEDFREVVFTAGFGRSFPVSVTRRLHAGAALRYTAISIPEFGSAGAASISAGLIVELAPGLDFGAQGFNLNRASFSSLDPLETRLDAGLAYRAHPQALVLFAASKDLDYPLSIRGGLEVQPIEVLFIRMGFSSEPNRLATGIGVAIGRIRADVAAEYHEDLGLTPAFEIGVTW